MLHFRTNTTCRVTHWTNWTLSPVQLSKEQVKRQLLQCRVYWRVLFCYNCCSAFSICTNTAFIRKVYYTMYVYNIKSSMMNINLSLLHTYFCLSGIETWIHLFFCLSIFSLLLFLIAFLITLIVE